MLIRAKSIQTVYMDRQEEKLSINVFRVPLFFSVKKSPTMKL